MTQSARVVWTYQDLEQMAPDGRRHEVLDGEWGVTPAPTTVHQSASKRLQEEGVREYWLVDTAAKFIEVLASSGKVFEGVATYRVGETATSVIFPFSIEIDRVFE
ncbi:MAG TPA: hypothetical protein VF989_17850 [Polyangiaceae bacterium]